MQSASGLTGRQALVATQRARVSVFVVIDRPFPVHAAIKPPHTLFIVNSFSVTSQCPAIHMRRRTPSLTCHVCNLTTRVFAMQSLYQFLC